MTNKKGSPQVLRRLLSVLCEEWGVESVRACLEQIDPGSLASRPDAGPQRAKHAKEYQRPSAVSMAERINDSGPRGEALRDLALKYDEKAFLPSIADVRHFMEMRGQPFEKAKQRPEAFRRVLAVLQKLRDNELEALREMSAHSGPTKLGPLSDAIRATSVAVRRNDAPPVDSMPSLPDSEPTSRD